MTTSSDVTAVRVQSCLNLPLITRCRELTVLIEKSSTADLQHVFPVLIHSLFGINDNVGWGLHSINAKKNPQEYDTLCYFLGPMGPIFSLCYKLLPDCYLKYNFPVSYLPAKIRLMLEEGIIPPFYLDKIKDDHNSRLLSELTMNPFEYYIFHFAYHLTNPWLQQPQQENVWTNWETIYVQLAHNYLNHFLPRDNSAVLPIIGPYVKKTPPRKLMQSPESKRLQTPRLLRTSILSPTSTSPVSGVPQQQCLPQVWRSETVVQVCLDFWLEYTEEDQYSPNLVTGTTSSLPRRQSIHSGEHIRLVRALLKTLHEFANSATGDKSAIDELKRVILPSVQGKIYLFLKKAIHHWPLDSSFRLILEAWLSFIQPWRYVSGVMYSEEGKLEEEDKGKIHDPSRWMSFVANNLLAYTAIFQQLLPRFMRIDLVAPKNSLMLFRVTKVFSQPHLTEMLSDIETCMDDVALSRGRLSNNNQWTAVVRQQILELEGPSHQYTPMFSVSTKNQVLDFLYAVRQAQLTAIGLLEALEKQKSGRKLLISMWNFFNSDNHSSDDVSLEERRKVPAYLAFAQERLIYIFRLEEEEFPPANLVADQEYHDTILSTSFSHQSQLDSSLDSTRPGVYVPIQDGKQNYRYVEYLGDPELQPVRSNEITILVRALYKLCTFLNNKYQHDLIRIYRRNDFIGRIAHQIIKPPTLVVNLPKRTTSGFTSGSEVRIPPRISFRVMANYHVSGSILIGMLFFWILGYSMPVIFGLSVISWLFYILARAVCEPWVTNNNTTTRQSSFTHN
ncbi:sphingomyelin phosphodiesterase 4 [Leptopilina heterotoma]|uniref:sphingomyelin phosphodiesterase 4 n=1 Tax=Leptopilina heterotoma TaxID=63436 RepID=UPI001CA7C260|nr:sphingomyelin phosphodiesterase 4 [Leptopilina heterotoma]